MSNEKDVKRAFSLGGDFMDFHTDDIVYGYMRNVSTAKPIGNGKHIEYLPYEKNARYKKSPSRKLVKSLCAQLPEK